MYCTAVNACFVGPENDTFHYVDDRISVFYNICTRTYSNTTAAKRCFTNWLGDGFVSEAARSCLNGVKIPRNKPFATNERIHYKHYTIS